jgi:hypothetical protein
MVVTRVIARVARLGKKSIVVVARLILRRVVRRRFIRKCLKLLVQNLIAMRLMMLQVLLLVLVLLIILSHFVLLLPQGKTKLLKVNNFFYFSIIICIYI